MCWFPTGFSGINRNLKLSACHFEMRQRREILKTLQLKDFSLALDKLKGSGFQPMRRLG